MTKRLDSMVRSEGVMQMKSVKSKIVSCVRRLLEGEMISD
jgi:hypothetical protein